jgi:predicted MPP superfamily phosphohydrolase
MAACRKWLLATGLAAGALGLAYARCVEPRRVSLDRYVIPIEKPGLPAGGLTILHLSDLHCRAGGAVQASKLARLRQLLAAETYDLVALTGDLIHDDAGLPTALELIKSLHPRLAAFSCPGNRDYWRSSFRALIAPAEDTGAAPWMRARRVARRLVDFARRTAANERWALHVARNDTAALHAGLVRLGVQPLVNAAVHVQGGDGELWVAGLDDLTQGAPDPAAALDGIPGAALLILLAHNPEAWLDPCVRRADLVLAGHTHGGQLRLPLVGALFTQGTHLTKQRPAGWFARGPARLFVSRGVGESFPFRFGSPPQAVLIRLVPANEFAGGYPKSAEAGWTQCGDYVGGQQ